MSELKKEKREREREVGEWQDDQRRLKVELGRTQAQLNSVESQLQQARERYIYRELCQISHCWGCLQGDGVL